MLKKLDTISLENGEKMTISVMVPPEENYSEKLAVFLRHKSDETGRCIKARLEGKYAGDAEDRYFIGEINGDIAGQLWYGYGKNNFPIANFGHVYTAPEHRKKGISGVLMKYFMDDFHRSPVAAALCTSSKEWIAGIYLKNGFKTVLPHLGPLMLSNTDYPEDFSAFEKLYHTPSEKLKAVKASMKYRHEIDCLLKFSFLFRDISSERVFISGMISSFQSAVFMQEDERGKVYCALTHENERCAGWSFCVNPLEKDAVPVFDWELHPLYSECGKSFIKQSMEMMAADKITQAMAYCTSKYPDKISILKDCGFKEETVLKKYCGEDNLYILRIKL
ncbi:MAG: hypothetical protein A2017_06160 [Lentisphaerae bacterium GWF2_44_16]|nr:MAG: hypothetical protein A2017_06160 [Lentisphaerae bacterium GWF2_44_16]